jgi:hypothetical protein
MFCSEVVPLLWYEKAVYTTDETFTAEFGLANHYRDLSSVSVQWKISGKNGIAIREDSIRITEVLKGKTSKLGNFSISLAGLAVPARYQIELSVAGTTYKNQWSIWVYNKEVQIPDSGTLATASFTEAIEALAEGRNVLLSPDSKDIEGITGKFVPVFWSPVHFPNQPGTMGLMIDPEHAAFKNFPTDFYSNWQWWDLCKNSKTILLDSLTVDPIVTVIDNFFKNRRLGNIFEAKMGAGKLIFASIDLQTGLESRPVARQLKYSLLSYMNSADFNPASSIRPEQILSLKIQNNPAQVK